MDTPGSPGAEGGRLGTPEASPARPTTRASVSAQNTPASQSSKRGASVSILLASPLKSPRYMAGAGVQETGAAGVQAQDAGPEANSAGAKETGDGGVLSTDTGAAAEDKSTVINMPHSCTLQSFAHIQMCQAYLAVCVGVNKNLQQMTAKPALIKDFNQSYFEQVKGFAGQYLEYKIQVEPAGWTGGCDKEQFEKRLMSKTSGCVRLDKDTEYFWNIYTAARSAIENEFLPAWSTLVYVSCACARSFHCNRHPCLPMVHTPSFLTLVALSGTRLPTTAPKSLHREATCGS